MGIKYEKASFHCRAFTLNGIQDEVSADDISLALVRFKRSLIMMIFFCLIVIVTQIIL